MTDALKKLLDAAQGVIMSEGEREKQRRSFAYGNTHFENQRITRAMIDREAEQMDKEALKSKLAE